MNEAQMRALFLLAGFEVVQAWELANGYWPDNEHYAEVRRSSPWWLVKTDHGLITTGWRRRVIQIDWAETNIEVDPNAVTLDNVTKTKTMVHAYGYAAAVTYLGNLRHAFESIKARVGGAA